MSFSEELNGLMDCPTPLVRRFMALLEPVDDARLEEIVRALESSYQRRVVVVDEDRRVLGIITDGDLLRRSRYAQDPGLLRRLRNLVTRHKEQMVTLPYAGETAGQLMTLPALKTLPSSA